MRVLFILPYVPSLIRVRPYNLLRELTPRHEITLLAAGSETDTRDAKGLLEWCRHVEIVPLRSAESVLSCATGVLRGRPLQASVCRSREFDRRLTNLFKVQRFDVVHVEHLRAAHAGYLVPPGTPTVYDSVDCISLLLERTIRLSHSFRQRLLSVLELGRTRAYEGSLLRQFDRTVVTAPEDRRALQALTPDVDVALVPNGVDLNRFRPLTEAPEPATLVFTGKMSYHANVTAALYFVRQVLPLIQATRPDVRLRIVGSSPVPEIQALARNPAITVTGAVPDMREAMRGATVAVCPVTVKVGIQNKVLEAMAMDVPVVSTREGLEGLAAQPGRDLLVADSAATFAEQVGRLLADPSLRRELGSAGNRYVQTHHRWDSAARQIEALYEEAISQRSTVALG